MFLIFYKNSFKKNNPFSIELHKIPTAYNVMHFIYIFCKYINQISLFYPIQYCYLPIPVYIMTYLLKKKIEFYVQNRSKIKNTELSPQKAT